MFEQRVKRTWKDIGAHTGLVQAFRKHWRAGDENTLVASMTGGSS